MSNPKEICWYALSSNPNEEAIHLLKHHLDKVNWEQLSSNPHDDAIQLLEQNVDKINWFNLSANPNPGAIRLLEQYRNCIKFSQLCSNPSAAHLLEPLLAKELTKGQLFVSFNGLLGDDEIFCNPWRELWANPAMIPFLVHHLEETIWHIHCGALSSNPAGVSFLEQHPEYIDWSILSANPAAISLLEQNMDKIDWFRLSANPNALHLLTAHLDKVNWDMLVTCNRNDDAIRLCIRCCNTPDSLLLGFENGSNENIQLLEQYPDCIVWKRLASNPNERATQLLVKYCYPEWVPCLLCNEVLLK